MKMSFLISRDAKFLYQKLEQMELENAELDNKNNELEIEIAELKEKQRVDRQCEACKLGDLIVENTKLKKENEDLKEQNEAIRQEFIEVRYRNEEYIKQIEKMKCCENCIKHRKAECSEDKKFYARVKRICNEWEFAENEN